MIAAVIPTLDRVADLRGCLDGVRAQTRPPEVIVVVDNGSSDGTHDLLAEWGDVTALRPGHNMGAPGGFAAGMREAFRRGAQWAWLLDDDAVPAPDALERMLERLPADGASVAGVAPTVDFGGGRREAGWLWGKRALTGRGQSPNLAEGEIDWAPFAGLLLRREACEQVGDIRADWMLWHADVEYCLRLRGAGFRLLAAPSAVVRHPAMPLVRRRVAGRAVAVGAIPPWREYYDTRNRWLLQRELRDTPFALDAPLARRAWDELSRDLAVLVAARDGPRRVWMRALGAIDGIRGNLKRRPELEGS